MIPTVSLTFPVIVLQQCPDIAKVTVDRAIQQLQAESFIEKVGKARASGYVRK